VRFIDTLRSELEKARYYDPNAQLGDLLRA